MEEKKIYKEKSLELLDSYKNRADEIFERVTKVKSNDELSRIKEDYRELKNYLKEEEKRMKRYEKVKEFQAFVNPALQDILHNSNLVPVNHVSMNKITELKSSLYNISDYAGYWYAELKGYEV